MSARDREKTKRCGSLKAKLTAAFIVLLALLIGGMWLLNRFFLPRYYEKKHIAQISQARELIVALSETPDDEALSLKLALLCESGGLSGLLVQEKGRESVILFTAGGDDAIRGRLIGMQTGAPSSQITESYAQTETYRIYKTRDSLRGTDQIDCIGFVEKDGTVSYYLLSVPVARIKETAALSNRFLLIIGLCSLCVGSVLIYFFSEQMTRPLGKLSSLSRKMAALDFSERYQGSGADEIAVLGDNINDLADKLEGAIGDLRKANLQLEQDVREKEEQNRRRKELLSNISHELKTPIALIQGYAEGLRDGMCEDPETRERYSDIIIDEAARMNRLVRQLLSLDELESGAAEVELSEFDLSQLLRSVAEGFRLLSQEQSAELKLDLPESLKIRSDAFMVEQIAQNYISNAFQYVNEGGTVRIGAEKKEDAVRISVFNTGEPIPEESLAQIWNKFYKVDKARTRSYGGSGIGLSIVKAAADRLDGRCGVCNKKDGVEFTVELPLR